MQLKALKHTELPREKLLKSGAASLSDTELLAIFLRTGVAGCNVLELAQSLMERFGGLHALLTASEDDFCQPKGLGQAKYVQVQAVMEMAKRALAEPLKRSVVVDNALVAQNYVASQLLHEGNEVFALMLLDAQHRLIEFEMLFQGTIHQTSVYPRVIVQTALAHHAAAVILCHNHPSGVAEPSQADIRLTARVREALALIDVEVLDHFVVGRGEVTSMAEKGLI